MTTADEIGVTTFIELSSFENATSNDPPTVTGTVYQAVVPKISDGDSEHFVGNKEMCLELLSNVETNLKTKAAEILQKNPWLASKVIKNPKYTMKDKLINSKNKINRKNNSVKIGSGKYGIEFQTELTKEECQKCVNKIVRIVTTVAAGGSSARLTESTSSKEYTKSTLPSAMDIIIADPITENTYTEIVELVRPFVHASTDSVVDSSDGNILWDIILIPLTDSETSFWNYKFLLVHSLNHSLADSNTFYKIYSMLSSNRPVEQLNPTRKVNLDRIKEEILGDDPNFLRSPASMASIAKRLVRVGIGSNPSSDLNIPPNQTSIWTVDEKKIQSIKDEYKTRKEKEENSIESSSPFLSTNDVLTSWFLRQNKDSPIGCLKVDMRSRHPDISPNLAGNYDAEIIYNNPDDVETGMIQASINRPDGKMKRVNDQEKELPGAKELYGNLSTSAPGNSVVTNWSQYYETVKLKQNDEVELEPELHLPIYLQHHGMLNSIGWNRLVVFRWSEDKVGLLVMAPPSATNGENVPVNRPKMM
mmetsp:Transcript_14164/g.15387  ORF Transcript_14164/g.15387 Transcript_14164/m.15387 type:complete len:533 (+) Transcript_14164:54-1652(+)